MATKYDWKRIELEDEILDLKFLLKEYKKELEDNKKELEETNNKLEKNKWIEIALEKRIKNLKDESEQIKSMNHTELI